MITGKSTPSRVVLGRRVIMNVKSLPYLISMFVVLTTSALAAQQPDSTPQGHWVGDARITVPWTDMRVLIIDIDIRRDGAVVGTIGDAQLLDDRLLSERSRVAKALNMGPRYLIMGRLSGPIIRAEAQQRERVRLGLEWRDDTLVGDLATSGTHDGIATDLVLTAKPLILRRAPAPLLGVTRAIRAP